MELKTREGKLMARGHDSLKQYIRILPLQREGSQPGFLTANQGFFPPEHAVCSSGLSFDGEISRSSEGALGQKDIQVEH